MVRRGRGRSGWDLGLGLITARDYHGVALPDCARPGAARVIEGEGLAFVFSLRELDGHSGTAEVLLSRNVRTRLGLGLGHHRPELLRAEGAQRHIVPPRPQHHQPDRGRQRERGDGDYEQPLDPGRHPEARR